MMEICEVYLKKDGFHGWRVSWQKDLLSSKKYSAQYTHYTYIVLGALLPEMGDGCLAIYHLFCNWQHFWSVNMDVNQSETYKTIPVGLGTYLMSVL
jgi:hypothetical protein